MTVVIRIREFIPFPASPTMGVPRRRPTAATCSGTARLVELSDLDAPRVVAGDVLVTAFAYGLGPVVVDGVKTGVAGEDGHQYEVPVVEARIPTGQQLAFAPEELYQVREAPRA